MRTCIKLGGALLETAEGRRRIGAALQKAKEEGETLLLVHGGGRQLAALASRLGLEEKRHQGLRITDAETALVATWVLTGEVNKALVRSLVAAGLPAVGLCGADLGLFHPRRKRLPGVDLGFVGELHKEDIHAGALSPLLEAGLVPVLATLGPEKGGDPEAPLLNVNADEATGPLAAAAGMDRVLFLTDVEGIRGEDQEYIARTDRTHIQELCDKGVISGGMLPKVRAALAALDAGIPSVRILSGKLPDPIQAANQGKGTEVRA
ncbi:MAG TPA: acetylglutamate kinase [Planctomycetes bacterium]|nr:acetylglutamate kinase [Planctomycetota bacterium]